MRNFLKNTSTENKKAGFKRFYGLTALFLFVLSVLLIKVAFSLTAYNDPVGYPTAWPGQLTTNFYTFSGIAGTDLTGGSGGDASTGGTNPSGNVDFSQGSVPAAFFSGNGSILFFRYRLNGPPLALTSNSPVTQSTWNLLLDTDGDGYKEFVAMLDGDQNASPSNLSPDDLVVIYDNQPRQDWDINAAGIWRQDSARHTTDRTKDTIDSENGGAANWDADPSAYVWDFGRIRVVQIDQTGSPGKNGSEYFLDVQVPVAAFDATAIGGPKLTSASRFSFAATTSNSNSNPTQKDALFNGPYTMCSTCKLPTGDIIDFFGNTYQAPQVVSVSASSCPAPIALSANVIDATTVIAGVVSDTINKVDFYYYLDSNNNGLADDGNSWQFIVTGTRNATVLGKFDASWNSSTYPTGNYLIKAIATDNQGNITDSTNQTNPTGGNYSVTTTFNNSCGGVLPLDFADAPNTFFTTNASGGPKHGIFSNLKIGANTDSESDGQPTATADGDDLTGSPDDEDGITFPSIGRLQSTYSTQVTVTNNMGISANLRGWIDFDNNGTFDDDEVSAITVVANGTTVGVVNLNWSSIPGDIATAGTTVSTRVRLTTSSLGVSDDIGSKPDGEVEDHRVQIVTGFDFGDLPHNQTIFGSVNALYEDTATSSGLISTIYLGNSPPDIETTSQSSVNANLDDNNGIDDDDGIISLNPLYIGATSYVLKARTFNSSGSAVNLKAWVDFDFSGGMRNNAESTSNLSVPNNASAQTTNLSWSGFTAIPSGRTHTYMRVRLTNGNLNPSNSDAGSIGNGEVEDYFLPITNPRDYSDAPDTYKTLYASDGASHDIPTAGGNVTLGNTAGDRDDNGFADGIDDTGTASDDDNLTDDEEAISSFPTLTTAARTYTISNIRIANTTTSTANYRAWIDFNRNGIFEAAEASSVATVAASTTTTTASFTWSSVPADISAGTTFARFRVTTDSLSDATNDSKGNKTNGEVEDYQLTISTGTDWGDAGDQTVARYSTNNATTGPRHNVNKFIFLGTNSPDHESVGQGNTAANGDDNNGTPDDEDGITTLPTLTTSSSNYQVVVKTTNLTNNPASLAGWIDFNNSGDFDDGEISSITTVAAGTSASDVPLTWSSIPATISSGSSYLRVRFTTDSLVAADDIGLKTNGEVEDYQLPIVQITDFGDAPVSYGTPSHTVIKTLYLGDDIGDNEVSGTAGVYANSDDNTGSDDENGLSSFPVFSTSLTSYTVNVKATNATASTANLRAWFDINADGDFADAGEASSNFTISAGQSASQNITWSLPGGLTEGNRYIRLRLSTNVIGTNDFTGALSDGEVEDYYVPLGTDFGDAPDLYQTLLESDGPRNFIVSSLRLGTNLADNDTDGFSEGADTSGNATDDDSQGGTPDDEDGITTFPTLSIDLSSYSVNVSVTNTSGSNANLRGWIDFNRDGDFADAGETSANISVGAGTSAQTLSWSGFSTPLTAGTTYVRIRLTSETLNTFDYYGFKIDGETEDYSIPIADLIDFGDAPNSYGTLLSSDGARHSILSTLKMGNLVGDSDGNGFGDGTDNNLNATDDDTEGTADEDGVASFSSLNTLMTSYSVNVNVSNTSGSNATLAGWIDFDRDGIFQADEGATTTVNTGTSGGTATLTWSNIGSSGPNITGGTSYARFRITTGTMTTSSTKGYFANGEVEDYQLTIIPALDFGDAPKIADVDSYGTLLTNNGARHRITSTLKMGTNAGDIDTDGFGDGTDANGNATDDDAEGSIPDDEDGVATFSPLSIFLTSYSVNVIVSNSSGSNATLAGWIDFDRDGIFQSDEGATVTVNDGTNAGTATLTWNNIGSSGPDITGGTTYARFRITTDTMNTTNAKGYFDNGEVEDYQLSISSTSYSISGTVFEDVNYGGGAGRNLTASNGVGRPNVRVELYSEAGNFLTFTTTNASGVYTFANKMPANYIVRVVNSTVKSSRTGSSSEIGVQTFRTNVASAAVVDVTDHVGGEVPNKIDAGNGSTTLAALTTGTTTAQSITSVTLSADFSGVDFGFNFDTIVNTNDSGQGSLRQFVLNSNQLSNSGLQQSGQTAGKEVSIFMIPNGVANPGQNASYTNQLTTYGAAKISLSSGLTITDDNTVIDGNLQTTNVLTVGSGETNPSSVGTGGTVGVNGNSLSLFSAPEVEVSGSNIVLLTVDSTATNTEIKSIAVENGGLSIGGDGSLIKDNLIGMKADGTISSAYGLTPGINVSSGVDSTIIEHNYLRVDNSAVVLNANASNLSFLYNEIDAPPSGQTSSFDGLNLIDSGTDLNIRYNLIKNMRGAGSEIGGSGGSFGNLQIYDNTYTQNGYISFANASSEPAGLIFRKVNSGSSVTVEDNIISYNAGPGVLVLSSQNIRITQNSTFRNGNTTGGGTGLGIDLDSNDRNLDPLGPLDGVTPNNGTVNATLSNNDMDYPIFTHTVYSCGKLVLLGYVGSAANQSAFANATIEIFKADDDFNNNGQIISGDGLSTPHGEGKTYLGSCNADGSGNINCTLNLPSLSVGDQITATARDGSGNTSEFSPVYTLNNNTLAFSPNNSKSGLPGATVFYPHILTSYVAGEVTFTSNSEKGWSYVFFRDLNKNGLLDAGDTQISGSSFGDVYTDNPSDRSLYLIVKVQIPQGTPINTIDNFTITATHNNGNICTNPQTVIDTTKVMEASLLLEKSVNPPGAQLPGTQLNYTIKYTNSGSGTLFNINIRDIVPAHTTFVSVSPGGVYTPATKELSWNVPSLAPGLSGNVTFTVQID